MSSVVEYSDLVEWLGQHADGCPTLVAVDGHGGSGKSTFARRLADHDREARVVHTDDFALGITEGPDVQRLRSQVIEPLSRGESACYQRFDWPSQQLAEWHELAPDGIVIVEGVSSLRREFGDVGDLSVWVEADRSTCLRRGLQRDGEDALPLWQAWLAEEDGYVARDNPRSKAELVVDGEPADHHDPVREFVVIEDRRRPAHDPP